MSSVYVGPQDLASALPNCASAKHSDLGLSARQEAITRRLTMRHVCRKSCDDLTLIPGRIQVALDCRGKDGKIMQDPLLQWCQRIMLNVGS